MVIALLSEFVTSVTSKSGSYKKELEHRGRQYLIGLTCSVQNDSLEKELYQTRC